MPNEPAEQREDTASEPYEPKGGEDEGSTEHDGKDDHLHDDQKPTTK
ncbi:hypothetical protein [Sphingomonas immobilis]|uniref:Uncharacterized protein n=1 Tax=Sphingomonas immobilis TaxID=3063997 RepID=A0ABT8ZWK6_9SPHN|nr:hypothetical protein [Sphingomonas sp. CA1-15]MDO7841933.1 hypothetical protein [Sphingomonas sp. CA1-15]